MGSVTGCRHPDINTTLFLGSIGLKILSLYTPKPLQIGHYRRPIPGIKGSFFNVSSFSVGVSTSRGRLRRVPWVPRIRLVSLIVTSKNDKRLIVDTFKFFISCKTFGITYINLYYNRHIYRSFSCITLTFFYIHKI